MNADVLILAALRDRTRYRALAESVPMQMLGVDAQCVLQWYRLYWAAFPEHTEVDLAALDGLIKLRGEYTPEQRAIINHILGQLAQPQDPEAIRGISNQLYERDCGGRAAALIQRYNNGEEIDLAHELGQLAQNTKRVLEMSSAATWEQTPIEELLVAEDPNFGLKFPTLLLSTHIAGLLGGDTVVLAARPDRGKGSFLAKTAVTFAKQIPLYFDEDRPILWLNNEGPSKRIVPRIYQAALKATMPELVEWSNDGSLRKRYEDKVGRADRIRVKDVHGLSVAQCERIMDEHNPCVVLWDMVANFRSPASAGSNKTDAEEAKWQLIRDISCQRDMVSIGTVQISQEGANMLYPPYSALKDSKTGVQGACDVIIMQGSLDDPSMAELRGFSTPKNKRQVPGKPSCCTGEVFFDAPRCDYSDGGTHG